MQVTVPNGGVWTRKPGGRSTGEQAIRAWEELRKLHDPAEQWNCWEEGHRTRVHERVMPVLTEWDNGAPKQSHEESEAFMEAFEAECKERWAEQARRRADLVAERYDKNQEHQRLVLLRHEADAAFFRHVLAAPASPAQAEAAEQRMLKSGAIATELREQIGDPDQIIDDKGYLPAERREQHLDQHMRYWRYSTLRSWSQSKTMRKQFKALLGMPRPAPAAMCSECQAPSEWHEYGFSLCLFRGQPEPGSIAERVARIMPLWWTRCSASTSYFIGHKFGGSQRLPDFEVDQWCGLLPPSLQQIFGLADMKPTPRREDPPAPKPLAVIKPGPIADVMGQLAEAQQAHPDAEVRRGKRGTWELWPS